VLKSGTSPFCLRSSKKQIRYSQYGEDSDYTNKGGVICTEILLPDHVPKEYANRETLWNAVEKVEKAVLRCETKAIGDMSRRQVRPQPSG